MLVSSRSPRRVLPAVVLGAMVALAGCTARSEGDTTTPASSRPTFNHKFDESRAWSYLQKQCDFGPRNPGSKGHQECRDWLQAQLAQTADKVVTQDFKHTFQGKSYTFRNIFGVYGEDKDRWIILCAHWDTRPFADQELDKELQKQPILGANDGASGVAVLLEMARMFKDKQPDVGVIIALFDGEDLGFRLEDMLLGSRAFAANWKTILGSVTDSVDYAILLDMVGAKDMRIPREPNSQDAAPWLMDAIWKHAAEAGLGRYFPDETGPAITDDHIPLIEAGIPAVDLIAFDYAYWHTVEDTPDKCSPRSLKVVGEVVARTVYSNLRPPKTE